MRGRRFSGGFSLIEVLVVVAIIGILSAFAFPAYRDYVTRSKFAEATSNLANLRVKMEQFYQDNRTYVGACDAGTIVRLPTGSDARYFDYDCQNLSATTFTLRAQGKAGMDVSGFTFTVDQANARATTVTGGSTAATGGWTGNASCWVTKKGGVC